MIMIIITIIYVYISMHYSFEGDFDWCLNISIDFNNDFDGYYIFPGIVLKSYSTVMLFDFCCSCKLYSSYFTVFFSFCWRGPIFFGGPTSHFFIPPSLVFFILGNWGETSVNHGDLDWYFGDVDSLLGSLFYFTRSWVAEEIEAVLLLFVVLGGSGW